MRNSPLVSIIMGTYNPDEQTLSEAIQSLIEQTMDSWELWIYDDGSDETAGEMIQKLATKDDRIHPIRGEENKGLAHALNVCLGLSGGKYIARMDDDDISYPERLETQIQFLRAHPEYAWVGCGADLFDEKGVWGTARRPAQPTQKDFLPYSPFIHPSVLFQKQILICENGYCDSPRTARCEDYELFMRLYAKGYRGYNLQDRLFRYREAQRPQRRTLSDSVNEMLIRARGFTDMKILSLRTIPYIIKPLVTFGVSAFPPLMAGLRWIQERRNDAARDKTEQKKYFL